MKEFIKKNKAYVIGLSISILLLVIDQIIKGLINKNIDLGEDKVVIDNFFYLTKSLNFGCLNGAIQDGRWLLIPITILALGFFVYLLIKTDYGKQKLFFIGMISVIGGALGNLFDRIFRAGGGVIDYLKFYFAGKGHDWFLNNLIGFSINPWPTFNFADICLTVGVIILFIAIIFFDKKEEKTEDGNN